jgi:ElaB/YqjD/DUF883 family membrane-anchored ribosome-binding protein
MESTLTENGQAIRTDTKVRKTSAGEASLGLHGAGQEARNLTADVQDLLSRIAHVADPEIARLRAKIERGLTTAKKTIADGTDRVQRQSKDAMTAADRYVRDRPWQAVGIAAAAGLVVGFLSRRR